jgi:cytidylate kinase
MTDAPPPSLVIAIDGPSGVGKGTIARRVARQLRYRHLDTGAMYRAVAWKALHDRIPLDDEARIAALAEQAALDVTDVLVRIDDHDVTDAIRTPEIDRAASDVSRLPRVRAALVARQRTIGAEGGIVVEGRDIGTVVFPGAQVKIYLDASPEERARRRAQDPAHGGGMGQPVSAVATALEARDRSDRTRAASPLSIAGDAVVIDTTRLSIEEVVEKVMDVVREKMEPRGRRPEAGG